MTGIPSSDDQSNLAPMEPFARPRSHMVELALLGPPEARIDSNLLTFRTKKALALLIYLAVSGGAQPREQLATLLWPDSDEGAARATLRSTVRFARHTLTESGTAGDAGSILHSGIDRLGRESLWLQPTLLTDFAVADLQRVEQVTTLSRQTSATPDGRHTNERLKTLSAAAEMCRGTFLEGFSLGDAPAFEDWVARQRVFWQGRMDTLFADLSSLQLQQGTFAAAVETAERWLRINPLQEAAYRRLMEAQAAVGSRDAALAAYARCRQMLARSLGVEPLPETVALAERLRTPQARASLPSHAPESARHATETPAAGARRVLVPPMVGRANEFAALVAAYERAHRGTIQVAVLEGEAGIGKTRLAREFLRWARETRGAEILRGRAFEIGGRLPYQPLTEALRARLERERAPEDLLDDVWLAELSRVLPDLRERYPDLALPANGQDVGAPGRLFEAMAQAGLALLRRATRAAGPEAGWSGASGAGSGPPAEPLGPVPAALVIFLDDMQWADVGTRDLLRFLIRRWNEASAPVLVLLAVRQEEVQTSGGLREWLRGLAQELDETAFIRQTLAPLDAAMVQSLVDTLFVAEGMAQSMAPFVRALYRETNGLPLYFVQMLRALLEQGVLAWTDEPRGEQSRRQLCVRTNDMNRLRRMLPATLRAVIQGRLERLAPATRRLLTAGAILGTRFRPEHAWALAKLDEAAGIDALEEAERHMVIRTSPGGALCEFAHDKIQNVIYDEVGEVRRKILHRDALGLLEREGGASAAELAHHALATGHDAAAFRYCLEAGDVAMQVFAVRDAITHYEHALRLLPRSLAVQEPTEGDSGHVSSLPGKAWEHLYSQLGRAYEWQGAWDEARAIYQAQRAYARRQGARTLEASTLTRMAHVAREQSWDLPTAQTLMGEALAMVEPTDDMAMLAETHWTFAQFAALAGEHNLARPHAERALELALAADQEELIARCFLLVAQIALQRGAWSEAATAAAQGREGFATLAEDAPDTSKHQAITTMDVATEESSAQLLFTGSLPSTAAAYRAMEAICLAIVSCAAINSGSPQAGVNAGQDAVRLLRDAPNTHIGGLVMYPLALGFVEMGRYEDALSVAQEGVAAARAGGDPYALLNTSLALAHTWHALGQTLPAHDALSEALLAAERIPAPYWSIPALSYQCAHYALAGDWANAYATARRVGSLRQSVSARLVAFDFLRYYETEALLRNGDVALAWEEWRRLGKQLTDDPQDRRHQLVYLRMQALLALNGGDHTGADASLSDALHIAEKIGLPTEQRQIHALLGTISQ